MPQLRSGKYYKQDKLFFYDFETSGFNPYHDSIIEIGAVHILNGNNINFSKLINPGFEISSKISGITNINNSDLKNADSLYIVLKNFISYIFDNSHGDVYLVAHNNNSFDKLFLEINLSKFNDLKVYIPKIKYIDSLRFAQKLISDRFSYSLKSLCNHFNIVLTNHHRAFDDSYNLYLLYKKLCMVLSNELDDSYLIICNNPRIVFNYLNIQ
jgi:DNA polymerase III alpha subunit (gram-positive type)